MKQLAIAVAQIMLVSHVSLLIYGKVIKVQRVLKFE